MNIPNFHDGHFDGLRIGASKLVNLFLRTQDGNSFILVLREADAYVSTGLLARHHSEPQHPAVEVSLKGLGTGRAQ